jgi:polyribonucleotide nucleotidyltransferase
VSTPDSSQPSPLPGERYLGTVVRLAAFGAFVSLPPGGTGLLHIDELRRVSGRRKLKDPGEVVGIGQQLQVEVNQVDNRGKVSLTLIAGPGG